MLDKQFTPDLTAQGTPPPREADWESVKGLVSFLEHFCTLTRKVSGSYYMTANMYLPEISDMYVKIKTLEKVTDVHVSNMATRMLGKFNKYWGDPTCMNMNMFFAVVLDPRHKFEVLDFLLENIYGPVKGPLHSVVVREGLARLFKAYLDLNASTKPSNISGHARGSASTTSTADGSNLDEEISG